MGKSRGSGDWLVLEELLDRGDPSFVERLRAFHDAEALASFAARWYGDRRAVARRFLLEYLDRPLDAYRHEPLVKRLFKLAEAAGDDEVMTRFLVLFDRSVRRVVRRRRHHEWRQVGSEAEARALVAAWEKQGLEQVISWSVLRGQQFQVRGIWHESAFGMPSGTAIPRGASTHRDPRTGRTIPDIETNRTRWFRKALAGEAVPNRVGKQLAGMRLFSVATRHYLRRRAWRHFRRLGRSDPGRYIKGVSLALSRYTDQDVPDGLGLIDNWGLIHILFHRSPVLVGKPSGWGVAEGRSLAELEPAPIYESLWAGSPRAIVDLLLEARCRPVRQWALQMIRRHEAARAAITVDELLGLLIRDDPDAASFAIERLETARGLGGVPAGRWLELIEGANPSALEGLVGLMRRHLDPRLLPLDQVARLAASRPLPVARLGLDWLSGRQPPRDEAERRSLLALADAECELLRPEIVRLVRERISASGPFDASWVLELIDSRHEDVRAEGIAWFRAEPAARGDVGLWQRLIESPYDDVRLALVAELEGQAAGGGAPRPGPDALRWLWASVLLNVHRGGRAKPTVVRQLVDRIERKPGELESLLPLLAVALRSSRGPERRAGLAAVARLAEHREGAGPAIRSAFPELKWR
jgi:hypothetical protein